MNKVSQYFMETIIINSGDVDPYIFIDNNVIGFQWDRYDIEIVKTNGVYHIRLLHYELVKVNKWKYKIGENEIYDFIDWLFTKLYPRKVY